jgi:hypothetical protein
MATKVRERLTITLPEGWDPDFLAGLDQRRHTTQWLNKTIAALEAYFIRPDVPDPLRREKIQSLAFKLLIRRIYEYQVSQFKPDVDIGGQTHLDTSIAALENSLRRDSPTAEDRAQATAASYIANLTGSDRTQ